MNALVTCYTPPHESTCYTQTHTHTHRLVERFLMDGYEPRQDSTYALTLYRHDAVIDGKEVPVSFTSSWAQYIKGYSDTQISRTGYSESLCLTFESLCFARV
jgi:hypothetical protein